MQVDARQGPAIGLCDRGAGDPEQLFGPMRIGPQRKEHSLHEPVAPVYGAASMSRSAVATAARRTASRSPLKRSSTAISAPPRCARANQTSPTGLSGVPPSGPATPVTATASVAPLKCNAPEAICSAVGRLTAPKVSITLAATPSACSLAALE